MEWINKIRNSVKEQKPLVHHITNWVTIYDCANIVRAVGALPVMAHAPEEVEQMTSISSALVLNIGTLTSSLVEAMIKSGKKANELGIPVILDAVGVGATDMRTEKANEIIEKVKVDVIKGNSSEVAKLAGIDVETNGVEATKVEHDLIELGKKLASEKGATVVITGKEDVIVDSKKGYICKNGHDMMGSIVGTGCMVASVIGSFCSVEKDHTKAAAAALSVFGIAGELAARVSNGPGSYKENFYDEIFNLSDSDISDMQKLEEAVLGKAEEEATEDEEKAEESTEEEATSEESEEEKTEEKKEEDVSEEPKEEKKEEIAEDEGKAL